VRDYDWPIRSVSPNFLMHFLCENRKSCYPYQMLGNENAACARLIEGARDKKDFFA